MKFLDYPGLEHYHSLLLGLFATQDNLNNVVQTVLSTVYPVGSVYISTTETSPANLFGGEWELIKDTFLLAAGDSYSAGETGGETNNDMPPYLTVYMWRRIA